jgi:hypothetical protein
VEKAAQNLCKKNNHPIGENSPNLVTYVSLVTTANGEVCKSPVTKSHSEMTAGANSIDFNGM